jgi:hypothetical protein
MNKYSYALIGSVLLFVTLTVVLVTRSHEPTTGAETDPVGQGDDRSSGGKSKDAPGIPDTTPEELPRVVPPENGREPPPSGDGQTEADRGPLPLEAGEARLVFVVVDDALEPLSGVLVVLLAGRRRAEQWTDGYGAAAFPGIAAGTYSYSLAAEDLPELVSAREVTLGPGESKELQLRLGDYDLSISGHVRDPSGVGLPGIRVEAREQLVQVEESRLVIADRKFLEAETGPDGLYEIPGLVEGDYVVSVARTEDFPSVRKIFRAGSTSADLVLNPMDTVEIYGVVTTADGAPLEGVRIVPMNQGALQAVTDRNGEYTTRVELHQQHSMYVLTARREGFREERVHLRAEPLQDVSGMEVNIVLEALGALAPVTGVLLSADGAPVPGETLHLQSPAMNARYQTVSNADGGFVFQNVQVGDDYRLLVYPKQSPRSGWLKDCIRSPLVVPEAGLDLKIELESLGLGTIQGTMVDPTGQPIPNFTVWVRSMKAQGRSMEVTGDAQGRFLVEDVPEGEILIETRSLPRLSVRGVRLAPDEDKEAVVVLDWGSHQLQGTVLDPTGAPVPGARVALHWTLTRPGLQSASFRNAITDAQGRFEFSELGAGEHRITVNCPGFLQKQTTHDVGISSTEPVLRLQEDRNGRPR